MDKYQMRVALWFDVGTIPLTVTRADGQVETIGGPTPDIQSPAPVECWERVENDRVVGYFDDAGALVSEPVSSLQARYIAHGDEPARTMFSVE